MIYGSKFAADIDSIFYVMNILLIDDDPKNVTLMKNDLCKIDSAIQFYSSTSSAEALDKLCKNIFAPHVVFLSCHRSNINFLRGLHQTQMRPAIFCLVTSTITMKDVRAFSELGVNYFLDKKVFLKKSKELLTTVLRTLGRFNALGR